MSSTQYVKLMYVLGKSLKIKFNLLTLDNSIS